MTFPNNPLVYRDSDEDGVGDSLDAFPYSMPLKRQIQTAMGMEITQMHFR